MRPTPCEPASPSFGLAAFDDRGRMRHRRASLYRYQITHVWGQLPAGVAVGVVVAESTYHGPTIEWAIWDMDGTEIAAWSARLIQ